MKFGYAEDGYAALGLTGNPFVAEPVAGVPAGLWIARPGTPAVPQPGQRLLIQLIGPKGAGKTSQLLHWRALELAPYHYVPPSPGRWRPPPVAPLAYWDEVDRLAAPVRAASFRYAAARWATVVAGTHEDLNDLARRCGLAVTTYHFPGLTAAVLQEWAATRIAAAARPGQTPRLTLDITTAENICARVGASLRDAAVALHVWAADQAAEFPASRPRSATGFLGEPAD